MISNSKIEKYCWSFFKNFYFILQSPHCAENGPKEAHVAETQFCVNHVKCIGKFRNFVSNKHSWGDLKT